MSSATVAAISVPVRLGADRMPLAVQAAGRYFDDAMLLRVVTAIESLSGWMPLALSCPAISPR